MKNLITIFFFSIVSLTFAQANKYNLYVVQKGDSYQSIATKFNMTVEELKDVNAYDQNTKLLLGVSLFVTKNTNNKYHLVKRKETLYSIAKQHHLSVGKLMQLNKLKNNTIVVGQYLKIK